MQVPGTNLNVTIASFGSSHITATAIIHHKSFYRNLNCNKQIDLNFEDFVIVGFINRLCIRLVSVPRNMLQVKTVKYNTPRRKCEKKGRFFHGACFEKSWFSKKKKKKFLILL